MAKTTAINERVVPGAGYETKCTVTLDNNYQSPGYPVALADFGFATELNWVDVQDATGTGYLFRFDPAQQTIRGFQQNGSTGPFVEIPNGTDLSAVTVVMRGKGR